MNTLATITGVGQATRRWMMAVEPSMLDRALGKWVDGAPASYLVEDGDGTILAASASISSIPNHSLMAVHADMVDPSIPKIVELLGLPGGNYSVSPALGLENALVFAIGSPAYLKVKCGSEPEHISDNLGFVMIKNNHYKSCSVVVIGTGNGTYHLVTGNTSQDSWRYFENEINVGVTDSYIIFENGQQNTNDRQTYRLIRREIKNLLELYKGNRWLKMADKAAQDHDKWELTGAIFKFRKQTEEYMISTKILQYIDDLSDRSCSMVMARTLLKVHHQNKDTLGKYFEKKKTISQFAAHNWEFFEKRDALMQKAYELGDYDQVQRLNLLQQDIIGGVL